MRAAFPIRWQVDWRLESARQRLAVALAISLLLHGLGYGVWQVAPAAKAFLKTALERVQPAPRVEMEPPPLVRPEPPKREVPMVFVEVDPAHAVPEPPKETKNYSTDHTLAANPEPKRAEVPKIDGTQTRVVKTIDTPKPQPKPLEPLPPEPVKEAPVDDKKPEPVKPKPAPPLGDLAMSRPGPKAVELSPQREDEKPVVAPPRTRPRTLQEAMARNSSLAGARMQQDGGVQRRGHIEVDARRSPFGNYDSVFINLVQTRWYQLLDNNQYMLDRRGKVALTFRLYHDGRIGQLEVGENTVGDMLGLLCQKSILDPSPFPKWPKDMRQIVGGEYREVKFTFFYD